MSKSPRLLPVLLCAVLILLSPGFEAYRACAAEIRTGASGPATIPGAAPALPALPAIAAGLTPAGAPAASAADAAPQAAASASQVLAEGVRDVQAAQAAKSEPGVSGALDKMFTGAPAAAGSLADAVPGETSATQAPLQPPALGELKALAQDSKKPDADRRAAVKAIAQRGGAESQALLEEIGTAAGGGAADYEVKRFALRSLYETTGKLLSLPPVSDAHKAELLAKLVADKPEVAAFDYDGTLEKHAEPASRETAAALRYAAEAGVRVMVLTDRPDVKDPSKPKNVTILESLSTLTPAERAAIEVGANRGARLLSFDEKGEPRVTREEPGWTDAQREALNAARAGVAARFGAGEFDGKTGELTTYGMAHFLPVGTPAEKIQEAAAWLQADLSKRGIEVEVVGRPAYKPTDPPYLTLSMIDKSLGVRLLRAEKNAAPEKTLLVGDHFMEPRAVDVDMVKGAPGALALAVGGVADPRLDNVFVWPTKGKEASQEILNALARRSPDAMNRKAVFGLILQRTVSIAAFIGTALAYPFVVSHYIGAQGYGNLLAMGQIVAIAAGPLTGIIVDRLSARKGMALNTLLRGLFAFEIPLTVGLGIINFWTLLAGAIANGWLLSSIMTTEGGYIKRLAGAKNVLLLNSLLMINYFVLQIVLNVIVGVGSFVTPETLVLPFTISAAANLLVVLPIIWLTIPDLSPVPKRYDRMLAVRADLAKRLDAMSPFDRADALESLNDLDAAANGRKAAIEKELAALASQTGDAAAVRKTEALREELEGRKPTAALVWSRRVAAAKDFLSRYRLPASVFAASALSYVWLASPLPIAVALVFWISRTPTFGALWNDKKLRTASLLLLAGAFVFYPIQSFALQGVAASLAGSGKALLYGRLLGALFLGQMLGNSLLSTLPKVKIPLVGEVQGKLLMSLAALTLLGVAVGTALLPGQWLMAGAAVAAMAGLMGLTAKLSPVSWVRFAGIGLAAIALPLLSWGSLPLLFAGVMLFGYAYGPSSTTLISYFQSNARKGNVGAVLGVHGSLFNTAISLGYGALALLATMTVPAFPGTLVWVALAALGLGAFYWLAPKLLPDLGQPPAKK